MKLAQRRARAEVYGEEWKTQLATLEGDAEKQKELESKQRDMFNQRLKLILAGKAIKEKTHLIECIEINDEVETKLAHKWYSEAISTKYEAKIIGTVVKASRVLKVQLYIETYGEDYQTEITAFQTDQTKIDSWRNLKIDEFDARLKLIVHVEKEEAKMKSESADFDVEWVKANMDQRQWAQMSERERQALLAKAKLMRRKLKTEVYGEEWQKQLTELSSNEASLRSAKESQRELYNARLAEMLGIRTKNDDILKTIVLIKYEIIQSKHGDQFETEKTAELELVKTIEEPEGALPPMLDN